MTVEVNVVGTRCGAKAGGLSCLYCYEGRTPRCAPVLDVSAVKTALSQVIDPRHGRSFSLFGGEPLLAPIEDLEELWAWGWARYKHNGVQTSGRPIRDEHFELFHKYGVCVSFSIDGPEELNDARVAGSVDETRAATAHSAACLERCLREKLSTGLIVTLTRYNAAPERLPKLLCWFQHLDSLGLSDALLHLVEHDGGPVDRYSLTEDENVAALLAIFRLQTRHLKNLRFGLFRDILALLRGQDSWKWRDGTSGGIGCTWSGCDPYVTPAVEAIEADGSRSMCGRVHKDGVAWLPAAPGPIMRPLVLRETLQEDGGCKGCRFFILCKGQCPGTALGGDWRKRTRDCGTWRRIFEHFEEALLDAGEAPVVRRTDLDGIEKLMAEWWAEGRAVKLEQVLRGERPGAGGGGNYTDHVDHPDHRDHDDLAAALGRGGEEVR